MSLSPLWLVPLLLAPFLVACGTGGSLPDPADDARYRARREEMVRTDLAGRDITDPRVLEAMRKVPRQLFVPREIAGSAYQDAPLPIGHDQTISQPYIVALMTQLARAAPGKKALDVGTGSGYQAAILAEICGHVYSVEILCDLAAEAEKRLAQLGYGNVTTRCGDGYAGWEAAAPFDLIIVAAAPQDIPEPLVRQLAPGGRLVIPVGGTSQELLVIEKGPDGTLSRWSAGGVRFVPMTGEAQKKM